MAVSEEEIKIMELSRKACKGDFLALAKLAKELIIQKRNKKKFEKILEEILKNTQPVFFSGPIIDKTFELLSEPNVRVWALAFMLKINPEKALEVPKELSFLEAKMILETMKNVKSEHIIKLLDKVHTKMDEERKFLIAGITSIIEKRSHQNIKQILKRLLNIAKDIKNSQNKVESLSNIAFIAARQGMKNEAKDIFNDAIKEVKMISDLCEKVEALFDISYRMAKSGFITEAKEVFEQALKTMEKVFRAAETIDPTYLIDLLADVAYEIAKFESKINRERLFNSILKLAETSGDLYVKIKAFTFLVPKLAELKLKRNIKKTLNDTLKDLESFEGVEKILYLAFISLTLAHSGFKKDAKKIFNDIMKLVESMRRTEKVDVLFDVILDVIRLMRDAMPKKSIKRILNCVIEDIKAIKDPHVKAKMLQGIAWSLIPKKDARNILNMAVESARSIKDPISKVMVLCRIASDMERCGFKKDAKEVFKDIMDIWEKEIEGKLDIPKNELESRLLQIISEIAKCELFDMALIFTEKIKDARLKQQALYKIALEMFLSDRLHEALDVLEKINDASLRMELLPKIALRLAELGAVDDALKIVNEIKDEDQKAIILCNCALNLC